MAAGGERHGMECSSRGSKPRSLPSSGAEARPSHPIRRHSGFTDGCSPKAFMERSAGKISLARSSKPLAHDNKAGEGNSRYNPFRRTLGAIRCRTRSPARRPHQERQRVGGMPFLRLVHITDATLPFRPFPECFYQPR
jgi:hypothetical protein